MADRRRINGPVGSTIPPVYEADDQSDSKRRVQKRTRPANKIRSFFLKTGVTRSASGSAYLELASGALTNTAGLKLTCTVHGPRALPPRTPFSPHIILSTHVKFAPFATKHRRGYLRDNSERDLSVHLETALRGAVIADRWPKSGVDIIISVIEGDQDRSSAQGAGEEEWSLMNVLSSCITVASAALADAGIDCVDVVAGGVAAVVDVDEEGEGEGRTEIVRDPVPAEHGRIRAACCLAYLPTRDEVTNLWFKGDIADQKASIYEDLIKESREAAWQARGVLVTSLKDTAEPVGDGAS